MRFSSRAWVVCMIGFALWGHTLWGHGAEGDARLRPEKKGDSGVVQWVKRMGQMRLPGEYERGHSTVTNAFREVAASSSRSTVRVLCNGLQSALGVIVRADGIVLTKASELDGKLECVFADGSRVAAAKVAYRDECDLALLKVSASNLPVVHWSESALPSVGSWLVTTNLEPQPVAIGIVSSPLQKSPMPRAILGVRMYRVDQGVRVNAVALGTGAARAGVRQGDVIATVNGRQADSPETISDIIGRLQPGDKVTLSVLREQETLSLVATLGDMNRRGGLDQTELMDSLGGPLSKRRAGFPSVIQHDSVIRPRECGGPVVDLDGQVVGVNIARASRVATFALPADLARRAVEEMLSGIPNSAGQETAAISTGSENRSAP